MSQPAALRPVEVGDQFVTKFPGATVRHRCVAVEPGKRVRLEAEGNRFRFWLPWDTIEQHWLKKRTSAPGGLPAVRPRATDEQTGTSRDDRELHRPGQGRQSSPEAE